MQNLLYAQLYPSPAFQLTSIRAAFKIEWKCQNE